MAGLLVAMLFAIVATGDQAPLAERAPSLPFSLPEPDFSRLQPPTTEAPFIPSQPTEPTERSPGWNLVLTLVQYGFTLVILALAAWAAATAWRHRPRLAWRRRTPRPDFVPLDDIAAAVVADADEQLATLRGGTPRNAIVQCWSRLEDLVAETGLPPDPSDTAAEFTERVLRTHAVDGSALDRLAMLYREARFSTHVMSEEHRNAAVDAIERLHLDLAPSARSATSS